MEIKLNIKNEELLKFLEFLLENQEGKLYNELIKVVQEKAKTEKVIKQVSPIVEGTNLLTVFFNSIQQLIEKKVLVYGRDLKISQEYKVTVMLNRKKNKQILLPAANTKVLYLRLSEIYPLYSRMYPEKDILSESLLSDCLKLHPSYIGNIRGTRFKWNNEEKQTSAIVLNYDILKEHIDIDLERYIQ